MAITKQIQVTYRSSDGREHKTELAAKKHENLQASYSGLRTIFTSLDQRTLHLDAINNREAGKKIVEIITNAHRQMDRFDKIQERKSNPNRVVTSASTVGVFRQKQVFQLDSEGKVIGSFPSTVAAGKAVGLSPSTIQKACRGIHATAGGFKWTYDNKATQ